MTDSVGPSSAGGWHPGRALDLALARVHLRTGALGLARAELEAMAGDADLDDEGFLDLAEARWRTGDLPGARDAAQAYLDAGGASPLALVIAAEAVAAAGRPGEARTLAGRALEAAGGPVDDIFAGMPRSSVWPADAQVPRATTGEAPPSEPGGHEPLPSGGSVSGSSALPTPDAASELDAGRAALVEGDLERAAVHCAVALRLTPALAPAVLEAIGGARSPALDLVRGDAFRVVGHESRAQRAYASASATVRAAGGRARNARNGSGRSRKEDV